MPEMSAYRIVELSGTALTRCSADLRYVYANPAAARMLGLPMSKIVGRSVAEVMGKEAFASVHPYIERVLRGELVSYELELAYSGSHKTWVNVTYTPEVGVSGEVIGWVGAIADISDRKRLEAQVSVRTAELLADRDALAQLGEETAKLWTQPDLEAGLQQALDATIRMTEADKGNVQLYDAGRRVLTIAAHAGFDSEFLRFFAEVSSEDDSACGRAIRLKERVVIEDVNVDEGFADMRAVARKSGFRAVQSTPLLSHEGQVLGVMSTHFARPGRPDAPTLHRLDLYARLVANFIERCRMDAERGLLMAELNHRTKNTLSTVTAIAQRSFAGLLPQDSLELFDGRIRTLAKTHGRLADNRWSGASLHSILSDEIAPYAQNGRLNVSVKGPEVALSPRCALTLCLAIHELVTNAAKHGALSTPTGKVSVRWTVDAERRLSLKWTESDGPAVAKPDGSGFGRRLLERGLAFELDASVTLEFAPTGVRFAISVPEAIA